MSLAFLSVEGLKEKNVAEIHSLEGLIGAGKTALTRNLDAILREERLHALEAGAHDDGRTLYLPIHEPVEKWIEPRYKPVNPNVPAEALESILEKFGSNMKRYAFLTQVFIFTARVDTILEHLNRIPERESRPAIVLIVERSLLLDQGFFENLDENGCVEEAEKHTYDMFYRLVTSSLNALHTTMVYIPTSPSKCQERITKRNRAVETKKNGPTLAYQEALERKHKEKLAAFRGRVIHLDRMADDLCEDEIKNVACQLLTLVSQ